MFNDKRLGELSRSTGFPKPTLREFAECGLLPRRCDNLDGMGLLRNLLEARADD